MECLLEYNSVAHDLADTYQHNAVTRYLNFDMFQKEGCGVPSKDWYLPNCVASNDNTLDVISGVLRRVN